MNSEFYFYKLKMAAPSEGKWCAFWGFFLFHKYFLITFTNKCL